MRYLMLVCWDAERMNSRPEPEPSETEEAEGFPWLDGRDDRYVQIPIPDDWQPPR